MTKTNSGLAFGKMNESYMNKQITIAKDNQIREPSTKRDYNFPIDYQDFNEMIGWPTNSNTGLQQPMTDYQIETHNAIQEYHRIIENKARKIGATEDKIRSTALNVFDRYEGHDIMIVAGQYCC